MKTGYAASTNESEVGRRGEGINLMRDGVAGQLSVREQASDERISVDHPIV